MCRQDAHWNSETFQLDFVILQIAVTQISLCQGFIRQLVHNTKGSEFSAQRRSVAGRTGSMLCTRVITVCPRSIGRGVIACGVSVALRDTTSGVVDRGTCGKLVRGTFKVHTLVSYRHRR